MGANPSATSQIADPLAARTGGSLNPCEEAGLAAEAASGLPAGLLLAIGRIESGHWDATRNRFTSWPWAINAAGKGQWFDAKEVAVRTVNALLHAGTRSIDVGCFQINLLHHPLAFANLEQAFDPDANARYAASFLLSLYGRTGTWEAAVETYHSADPALGFAYRQQVFSTWLAAPPVTATAGSIVRTRNVPMLAAVSRQDQVAMPAVIAGVQVWTPMPVGTAAAIVAMPPPPRLLESGVAGNTMAESGSPENAMARGAVPAGTRTEDAQPARSNSPLPVVLYRVMPGR